MIVGSMMDHLSALCLNLNLMLFPRSSVIQTPFNELKREKWYWIVHTGSKAASRGTLNSFVTVRVCSKITPPEFVMMKGTVGRRRVSDGA
jgi:hypothetical protein